MNFEAELEKVKADLALLRNALDRYMRLEGTASTWNEAKLGAANNEAMPQKVVHANQSR